MSLLPFTWKRRPCLTTRAHPKGYPPRQATSVVKHAAKHRRIRDSSVQIARARGQAVTGVFKCSCIACHSPPSPLRDEFAHLHTHSTKHNGLGRTLSLTNRRSYSPQSCFLGLPRTASVQLTVIRHALSRRQSKEEWVMMFDLALVLVNSLV